MKKIILLLSLCVGQSCSNPDLSSEEPVPKGVTLKHLNWLTGIWKYVKDNQISYEVWTRENDTLLKGDSYTLVGSDTVFSEKLELVQRGTDIFYIPLVKGQNSGQRVPFKFMEFKKGEFNFANKDHDFPRRIIYKNPQPDFLCARIEGNKNGKFTKIDFNFLKVK